MTNNTSKFLIVLAALSIQVQAAPSDPPESSASATELQAALGNRFRIHNTDHFSIVYDTPYETLRPLTARLEGIYDAIDRFCGTLDFPIRPLASRLVILIFSRHQDFLAYAQKAGLGEGAAGFYSLKNNIAAFVDVMDSPSLRPLHDELTRLDAMLAERKGPFAARRQRDEAVNRVMALRAQRDALVETFNRLVLQHEAAHQVLFNRGVHVRGSDTPVWLVEGLACQFEVPQSNAQGALKRVNQMRLGDLRETLATDRTGVDSATLWQQAVKAKKVMPFRELIGADQFAGDNNQITARYAESWALVYYLYRERPQAFKNYLARLAAREVGREVTFEEELADFEAAFGPADDALVNDWITFMLRLRYDGTGR